MDKFSKKSEIGITIAIPFFNAEAYLADAIRSVFAQSHEHWELILINDGSTDNSLKIAKSITDPRVRVISDGQNMKLAARLNQIINLANYDYIARMDADDLMSPERLAIQIEALSSQPDIDLISCGLFSIKNNSTLIGIRGEEYNNYTFDDLIWKRKKFVHAALLARKSWFKRNPYNQKIPLIEDTELWLRAAKKNDFKAISLASPLYIYREEDNITTQKLLKAYALERKFLSGMIENTNDRILYTIQSTLKTSTIIILNYLGILSLLQRKRNPKKPNLAAANEYKLILKKINSTLIPGLDIKDDNPRKNHEN